MDPSLAAAIRGELRAFVTAAGRRRVLPTTCHVGHPGGQHGRLRHEDVSDAGLRADLVERVVDGLLETDGACGWVTRSGPSSVTDADAEWFVATRTAFDRHGLALPAFFVLNRTGWLDLVSGEHRQWSRIRHASSTTPPPRQRAGDGAPG
jgi:hypothetical protein